MKTKKNTKKFPPRIAGMWINSYKDKKTGKEKKFYKLSVDRTQMIKLLKKIDSDYVALVGFRNPNKEEDKHPDVQFQESKDLKKGKNRKSRRDDEDEEEEEDDEEAEEDGDEDEEGEDEESEDDDELPF